MKLAALLLFFIVATCCTVRAVAEGAPQSPKVIEGNSQFAFDLFAKLRSEKGNLFFSPYSLSTALAMTYGGAREQTSEEMARTLHFTLPPDKLHPAMGALYKSINTAGQKGSYKLSTANALWGQKNFGFLPDFLNLTKQNYGAGFHEVDFQSAAEAARKTINDWVEKETHNKIKELLKPGVVGSSTRLVLTNAIYFKGDWERKFKKELTRDEPFHLSMDKQIKTPMMNQSGDFKYADEKTYQALELPYVGKELSMLVLLPKRKDGLEELEKTLGPKVIADCQKNLRSQEVIVSLPKFKMTSEFSLANVLSQMGMPRAFEAQKADFSGMSGSTEKLYISAVVHKAFVEVNEEGTEAAAATGIAIKATAIREPTRFRADHPFVFLIRDNRTGSVLFMGRVMDPSN